MPLISSRSAGETGICLMHTAAKTVRPDRGGGRQNNSLETNLVEFFASPSATKARGKPRHGKGSDIMK